MAHTNVTIYPEYCTIEQFSIKIQMLEAELAILKKRYTYTIREMENIFEAIEEYGHVDLTLGSKTMRIIKDPAAKEPE